MHPIRNNMGMLLGRFGVEMLVSLWYLTWGQNVPFTLCLLMFYLLSWSPLRRKKKLKRDRFMEPVTEEKKVAMEGEGIKAQLG